MAFYSSRNSYLFMVRFMGFSYDALTFFGKNNYGVISKGNYDAICLGVNPPDFRYLTILSA